MRPGTLIRSSADVARRFSARLAKRPSEALWVLALDKNLRLLDEHRVGQGSLGHCPVPLAAVYQPLLKVGARAAVLVHNHPSGSIKPSLEDIALTRLLAELGYWLGVEVLDHVVIGLCSYFSFHDAGICLRGKEVLH